MNRPLVLALLALAAPAAAANTSCRVVSGGGFAFGSYDILSARPADSQATLTVSCERNGGPAGVTLTVGLDQGNHGSSVSARRMRHAGGRPDFLRYGLYRDAARTSVWGSSDRVDTMDAVLMVPDRGTASVQFTIFGRIPPRQDVHIGSYGDAVRVTILY